MKIQIKNRYEMIHANQIAPAANPAGVWIGGGRAC